MVLTSVLMIGELVAVLAEHLLQHDLGALHAGLVELALDVEADLLLLEALHARPRRRPSSGPCS